MESVETTLRNILFQGDGFAIYSTEDGFSAKGSVLEDPKSLVDTDVTLLGDWGADFTNKWGKRCKTFAFTSYQIRENQTIFFLLRMVRAGIPAKTARKIATDIGDKLGEVIENEPQRLRKYTGIGEKKLEKIVAKWAEFKHVKRLGEILLPYGITNNLILRVFEHFGEKAAEVVISDTYRLTEVRGIGFKKADEVAMKLGVAPQDPRRIAACVMFCMNEKAAGDGHSAVSIGGLLALVNDEIESDHLSEMAATESGVFPVVEALVSRGDLSVVDGVFPEKECCLAVTWRFGMEKRIINACKNGRPGFKAVKDIDGWIDAYEKRTKIKLGDQQRAAVVNANSLPPILCVSGYAGTGKTTTSKAILQLYAEKYGDESIVGCALSGIAANRVRLQSGFPAMTVHSLLGFMGADYTYNGDNPLPYQVILLDEGSMVDSEMLFRLVSAINFKGGAHLIILGDPAQLPPVGAGQPFADMLDHNLAPAVKLDRIYRQSEDAVITLFAADVRQGTVPAGLCNQGFADFRYLDYSIPDYWKLKKTLPEAELKEIRERNNTEIREAIARIAISHRDTMLNLYSSKQLKEYITYFQVLSPINDYAAGVKAMNKHLQSVLNPPTGNMQFPTTGDRAFRVRDKVVHLKNKNMEVVPMGKFRAWLEGDDSHVVESRVFNGQLGVVIKIDADEDGENMKLHVCYPNEGIVTWYEKEDLSSYLVDHAFCLTGHKSQGSEFKHVVFPMTLSHFVMLNPKWLYTAMTRAKEHLTIVGQKYAFEMACKRGDSAGRRTCLQLLATQTEAARPVLALA